MDIITPVLGGLALFLFGMTIMGEGLQKSSGNKLKKIVGSLTRNKYIGVLLGIVVTMVIQSSSAATVMVVGFVNAGLMPLNQAVGVIIGANVGTTITAQIIAFDIAKYAPLIVAFGVLLYMSAKDDRKKNLGEVFVGLGLIFIGMNTMGDGLNPLSKELWFKNALLKLNSPIIGVFVGFFLTTAVQSSSASIGLIQALGKQGLLTINQAAPLLLGGNIGTTTTALLSSVGAGKNAKRAAIIHLLFNAIGTIIVLLFLNKLMQNIVSMLTPLNVSRQIANYHTLFNIINVAIQLPVSNFLVKAAMKIVPGEEHAKDLQYLDDRILETPSIAVEQARLEVIRMSDIVYQNFKNVDEYFMTGNKKLRSKILAEEKRINNLEKHIVEYLVKLSNKSISDEEHTQIFIMQDMLNDLERIGDHVENICGIVTLVYDEEKEFSKVAIDEYKDLYSNVENAIIDSTMAFKNNDQTLASKVANIENNVDFLEKKYRHNHIKRINNNECDSTVGVNFLDILSNLERISDHCTNISNYTLHIEV